MLSVICIIANIGTIAYMFTFGWGDSPLADKANWRAFKVNCSRGSCLNVLQNCDGNEEEDKSFCCSPHLYIISPWKWQCSILQEIIECDKKENK